jgi:hypothetical protein
MKCSLISSEEIGAVGWDVGTAVVTGIIVVTGCTWGVDIGALKVCGIVVS